MTDHPRQPTDPEPFRFQDEPSPSPAGGAPAPAGKPERPRRRRPARRDRPAEAPSPSGGAGIPWLKSRPHALRDGLLVAGLLVPLIGFAAFMAIRQVREESHERTVFGANVASYLVPAKELPPGAPRPALGKVVLVDADKRALDEHHFALPDDLRAYTPADVTTIVQVHYTPHQVGVYEGGGKALQLDCTLTVIDKASQALLGTATFHGPPPPATVSRTAFRQDVDGGLPMEEIIAFLRQLRKG
jgi:hypothetical protein